MKLNLTTTTAPVLAMLGVVASLVAACSSPRAASAQELPAVQQHAVAVARRALKEQAHVAEEPQLQSIEARQWPTSALGCPQPGLMYLQVVTDGYALLFKGNDRVYEVHTTGDSAVLCPTSALGEPRKRARSTPRATNLDVMERQAVADLAQRIGAEAPDIRIVGRAPQRWPDASLGCNNPAQRSDEGPVAGFRLLLRHQERIYVYHTDLERVMPCPPIEAE